MKRSLLYLLLLFPASFAHSQTLRDVDTSKYRIYLPDYWKSGNKIWKILTEKLPSLCEEIRDKELCGDNCNPKYTLELEVFEPVVKWYDYYCIDAASSQPYRNWIFNTYYNFQSSFILVNERREIVTRIIFIDTSESFHAQRIETYRMERDVVYRENSPTGISLTRTRRTDPGVPQPRMVYVYRDNFNPSEFIRSNQHRLFPTDVELFTIIDNKIRSW